MTTINQAPPDRSSFEQEPNASLDDKQFFAVQLDPHDTEKIKLCSAGFLRIGVFPTTDETPGRVEMGVLHCQIPEDGPSDLEGLLEIGREYLDARNAAGQKEAVPVHQYQAA